MNCNKLIMLRKIILSLSIVSMILAPEFETELLEHHSDIDFFHMKVQQTCQSRIAAQTSSTANEEEATRVRSHIIGTFIARSKRITELEHKKRHALIELQNEQRNDIEKMWFHSNRRLEKKIEDEAKNRSQIKQEEDREIRRALNSFADDYKEHTKYEDILSQLTSLINSHLAEIIEKLAELSLIAYCSENEMHKTKNNNILNTLYKKIKHMISQKQIGEHFLNFELDYNSQRLLSRLRVETKTLYPEILERTILGNIISKIKSADQALTSATQAYLDSLTKMINRTNHLHRRYLLLKYKRFAI